jgi:hypothetical protein
VRETRLAKSRADGCCRIVARIGITVEFAAALDAINGWRIFLIRARIREKNPFCR